MKKINFIIIFITAANNKPVITCIRSMQKGK